ARGARDARTGAEGGEDPPYLPARLAARRRRHLRRSRRLRGEPIEEEAPTHRLVSPREVLVDPQAGEDLAEGRGDPSRVLADVQARRVEPEALELSPQRLQGVGGEDRRNGGPARGGHP